jgi:hypothetical protein
MRTRDFGGFKGRKHERSIGNIRTLFKRRPGTRVQDHRCSRELAWRPIRLPAQGDEPSFFETGRNLSCLYRLRGAPEIRSADMELGGTLLLQAGTDVRPGGRQYVGNPLRVGRLREGQRLAFNIAGALLIRKKCDEVDRRSQSLLYSKQLRNAGD